MRINPNQGGETVAAESNRAPSQLGSAGSSSVNVVTTRVANAVANGRTNGVTNEDQAQLSGTLTLVQSLAAQALQLPEIRAEKVSALRQAVESGSYQADPGQVADALLSHLIASRAA